MSKIEKSYEYKSIQGPKMRESMKMSAKRHYDEYYPRYWDHGCEIVRNMRIVARKMIEKGVGKPYAEIYSKFIERYPESKYYINCNPKDIFKENFSSSVLWNNVYEGDFYLDENYIIRKRESEPIKVNNKRGVKFKWNIKKYPYTHELMIILKVIFGDNAISIIDREYNIEEIYKFINKIRNNTYIVYGFGNSEVKKLATLILDNLNIIHNQYNKYFENQIFLPIEFQEIENQSYRDKRKLYYIQKHNIKTRNIYWKWKRSYDGELYLRTYKLKQKLKFEEENDITIERLGFDKLISFRGIEYHGQKRKRKSSIYR